LASKSNSILLKIFKRIDEHGKWFRKALVTEIFFIIKVFAAFDL